MGWEILLSYICKDTGRTKGKPSQIILLRKKSGKMIFEMSGAYEIAHIVGGP